MRNKRHAFTMIELITACVLLTMITAILINTKMVNQTAEREAKKILEWINKLTQKSNRDHQAFTLWIDSANNIMKMHWNNELTTIDTIDESLNATSGCKYSPHKSISSFVYTLNNNYSPFGTITITGTDGSKYYLIFSKRGRARISKFPPDDEDDE